MPRPSKLFFVATSLVTLFACSSGESPAAPGTTANDGGTASPGSGTATSPEKVCHRAAEHYTDKLCENFASSGLYTYSCGDKTMPEKALQCIGPVVNGFNCCKVNRADPAATPEADAGSVPPAAPIDAATAEDADVPPTPKPFTLEDLVGNFAVSADAMNSTAYRGFKVAKYQAEYTVTFHTNVGTGSGTTTLVSASPASIDVFITTGSCGGGGCMIPLDSPKHYPCDLSLTGAKPKRTLTLGCGNIMSGTYQEN